MIQKLGSWIAWYFKTATLVGVPVLGWIIIQGISGCISEVTCHYLDRACEHSFTMSHDAAIERLSRETERCPDGDCVAKKGK